MTTGSGEPPMTTLQRRVAHAMPWLIIAVVVERVLWYADRVPNLVDLAVALVIVGAYFTMIYHFVTPRLCLSCLRNAPLDPQGEVNQWDILLRWRHLPTGKNVRIMLAALALTYVGIFIDGWVSVLFRIPFDALWLGQMYAFWMHHRLQPWCPYCRRWDEGGDPELVPDPDPAEGKKIT